LQTKIIIPKGGMGTTEGTILRWLRAEGDSVNEGEVVAEIETAKAVQEVAAPTTGTLVKILLLEGQTAEVFTAIGLIETSET
jgi:pyruvate/2-oxoglutarate dehydrogenase complex dihydrolipoamide acyltransferase (E2) component